MRRFAFFAPLAAAAAVASLAHAEPTDQPAEVQVSVEIGGDLIKDAPKLGQRDVDYQRDELAQAVSRALNHAGTYPGAQVRLVLTDLKPNHPTMQQTVDRPGLSMMDSVSIGGATIEGEIITADGRRLPVQYSRYSTSIADVHGFNTWEEADRAYDDFARNLVRGRLVER
ncbi:hypothetical protein [Brevundimonas goettingensis]|uniref:DUF3016 domain-containing protein n=1 Tax=Brevundimonas goettingensis TaxID=2774190 RepID=A0A975GYR4_9CAUL|nr:hypothetical protein [Brevundimonas goettingensis]QTC91870.1 hypothetical protein IFJ75_02770 [Brevundimonas goettingensis]